MSGGTYVIPEFDEGGGGTGSELEVQENGVSLDTDVTLINFVGPPLVAVETAPGEIRVSVGKAVTGLTSEVIVGLDGDVVWSDV